MSKVTPLGKKEITLMYFFSTRILFLAEELEVFAWNRSMSAEERKKFQLVAGDLLEVAARLELEGVKVERDEDFDFGSKWDT